MKPLIATAIFIAALVGGSAAAQTAATDIGKLEFNNNCAVCHGTTGKGDGPAGMYTTPPAADLTTISKRNNGLFPFARLYETIDGTRMAKGHGTREMPIWGNEYNAKAARMLGVFGTLRDQESFTRGRIVALIGYIYSLQKQ